MVTIVQALFCVWLTLVPTVSLAFVMPPTTTKSAVAQQQSHKNFNKYMVKYDKKASEWVTTSPDEEPSAGYGVVGALLRHGPKPALDRVTQPAVYEQAVLKFMAQEKCSRQDAEGNMDAFRRNPNDWMEARYLTEKTGYVPDYVTLKPGKLFLTLAWVGVLSTYVYYTAPVFLKYLPQ